MHYRPLGKSGLMVSEIGFGCGPTAGLMVWGEPSERRRVVERALEMGITYFDTAPVYGDGTSEAHLGQALEELGEHPIIGTKVGIKREELDDIPGAIRRSMETSLKRLRRDEVDVLHLHNRVAPKRDPDARGGGGPLLSIEDVLGPGGVAETFEALQKEGKTRLIGMCAFGGDVEVNHRLIHSGRFQSMLASYNLLNPSAGRALPRGLQAYDYGQVIQEAAANGMGIVALRVLAAGALTGHEERHPLSIGPASRGNAPDPAYLRDLQKAHTLRFLAAEGIRTMAQAAIQFALSNHHISTALVGFTEMNHLEEAVAGPEVPELSADALARLERLYLNNFDSAP